MSRPAQPATFAKAVAVDSAKVAAAIQQLKKPIFRETWGPYKGIISQAQYFKCAYCERNCIANQDGDVEHFAPKSEVRDYDPSNSGKEQKYLSRVVGRKTPLISATGYWWLAYDWSNYLLSCYHCNRKWKRNLFPVNVSNRLIPPVPGVMEPPLLINPFDDPDATVHFAYTKVGAINPVDHMGKATIETCGLDRPSLIIARSAAAARAFKFADRVLDRINRREVATREAVEDLLFEGHIEREHAGVARSVWRQLSGLPWVELERLALSLP